MKYVEHLLTTLAVALALACILFGTLLVATNLP